MVYQACLRIRTVYVRVCQESTRDVMHLHQDPVYVKGIKRTLVNIQSCESVRELAMDGHGF